MRTAVVVGASVAGLATAGALAKAGWQVTLVERADRLRSSGGAHILWPNGLAALRALGLNVGDLATGVPAGDLRRSDGRVLVEAVRPIPALEPTGDDEPAPQPASLYRAVADGESTPLPPPPKVARPTPVAGRETGPQAAVLHADDLHDLLLSGLGGRVEIRNGTEVTGVGLHGDWPTVTTARQNLTADLVVGADGAQSLVRRRMVSGTRVQPSGYSGWRAIVPWFRVPVLPAEAPVAGELVGDGMRFWHAPLGPRWSGGQQVRGGAYWWATAPGASRPEPLAQQLILLRRWFADWAAPVGELLAATEPDDVVAQPAVYLDPVPENFSVRVGGGGVVLVGDAAHATTPAITQGAGLALEDAAVLGGLLRTAVPGEDLIGRLDEFTRARRDRVVRVGRAARRLDRIVAAQGRLLTAARDALLPRLATRLGDPAAGTPFEIRDP